MSNWSDLMQYLDESDFEWLLIKGVEKNLKAGSVLIEEGTQIDSIYFVLKGIFKVTTRLSPDIIIAKLGEREIIGELSFIDNRFTSASIIAEEDAEVLAISKDILSKKINDDISFAKNFYRALCSFTSQRLRNAIGQFGELNKQVVDSNQLEKIPVLAEILSEIKEFKKLIADTDLIAIKNNGIVPDDTAAKIQQAYSDFCVEFNRVMTGESGINDIIKGDIGQYVKNEILPFMLLTQTGERYYSKPRGYAGDFFTIEMIYRNEPDGTGRIGKIIDKCFLDMRASKAVRNRRALLAEEIMNTISTNGNKPVGIMSMASGPAREIFDVYEKLPDKTILNAILLDIDLQALSFVDDKAKKTGISKQLTLVNENLIYLSLGRKKFEADPLDLVYSIGLIDYFDDKLVVKLIDFVYDILKPQGKVILGNFHPLNTDKATMDYILDWKLIHRSEDDMNHLFIESKFGKACTKFRFEEEKINLFAECIKD